MYEGNRYSHQEQVTKAISTAAVHATVEVPERIRLVGWGFTVTTAIVAGTTTNAVVTLQKLAHDRTTKTALGTITVDADMDVGHVDYRDLGPTGGDKVIEPGEAVLFETTTEAAGGTPAGSVKFFLRAGLAGDAWNATYHHLS